jgi:6-phosphogluconolactonase
MKMKLLLVSVQAWALLALVGCSSTPTTGCGLCRRPQAEFLYAYSFSNSSIETFNVDLNSGMLSSPTIIAGPPGSQGIAATPAGNVLYVSDSQADTIDAFSINPINGGLAPLMGSPFSVTASSPQAASGLAMNPNGKFLYVTEFSSGTVAGFSINRSTGVLSAVPGSPFPAGSGPVLAAEDASGKFLYVSNLLDPNGGISAYMTDSANGSLSLVPGSPFATVPNGSPQFLVVHPSGKFLYVVLDDANAGMGHVAAFTIGNNGALSLIAGSLFAAGNFPLGVAIDAAGKFLFTANNGDGTLSAFRIDSSTGALTVVAGSPFSAGTNQAGLPRCPYALEVDPTGKFLYSSDGCNPAMLTFGITPEGALASPSVTTTVGGAAPLFFKLVQVP